MYLNSLGRERALRNGRITKPMEGRNERKAFTRIGRFHRIPSLFQIFADHGGPESWVFPSENGMTPISKDNCWRRKFLPRLKTVNLQWANFQVMRKTHSCLLDELGIDPQVRADQMGHSVDVNQNQYTRSSLKRRLSAVSALEKAVGLS
jgi:integrase